MAKQNPKIGALAALELRLAAHDAQRHQIIAEIDAAVLMLRGTAPSAGTAPTVSTTTVTAQGTGRRPGFRMSDEAKAKISASAKARWAAKKGQALPAKPAKPAKRRTMSREAKKNMSAGMRRWWAKRKAAANKPG
jgi:hypothetical protein